MFMFGQRILILIPHPDDEIVGCCAAIGKALGRGARVFGFYLTTGVPPREVLCWWQRARYTDRITRRRREAREAANLLGVEVYEYQKIPSRALKTHLESTRESIQQAIQSLSIDTVWVPAYEGAHQDHDACSFLASTLNNQVEVWEFSAYNYFGKKVRSQKFFDPNGTEQFIKLDSSEKELKRRALSIYRSERSNLSYVDVEQEVFRPKATCNYAEPPHHGRLFYQRFQWVRYHPRVDFCQPQEVCKAFVEFMKS
jgi:LmbE family N-acetylglucosaminyl deacetylase